MKTINDIVTESHMTKREFCRVTGIPYQTLLSWTSDPESTTHRTPPAWQVRLIDYFMRTKGYEE